MASMHLRNPSRRIALVFLAWKLVLFFVLALAPGPGYDTSALIAWNSRNLRHTDYQSWSWGARFSLNFLRWDALYFVKSAQRGYVFEQEWAFSWAFSLLVKNVVKCVRGTAHHSLQYYVLAGTLISNACHLAAALLLYRLLNIVLGHEQNGRLPFVASVLHIMSPAGIFLGAPYAESPFAALNFLGMLLYAQAWTAIRRTSKHTIREDALILGAGAVFVLATWMRSNGLLSGLLFVFDVVSHVPSLLKMQLSRNEIRRLMITCASGGLLGLGSVVPQYVAYQEFCMGNPNTGARPWCYKTVPSIYTWVQSHYWNVGFLRYWTMSNIPLFIMATPMLWLLLQSGIAHLRHSQYQPVKPLRIQSKLGPDIKKDLGIESGDLPQIALPQLMLATAAATNFHVQVINRLSSGYPIWYLAVARWLTANHSTQEKARKRKVAEWICRGMIIYATVQGALFANFLPPA